MVYDVTHITEYNYSELVSLSHHLLKLAPRALPRQRCLSHEVKIIPEPAVSATRQDYFGNMSQFVTIEQAHRKLVITALSRVANAPNLWPDPVETPAWEVVRDACRGRQIGSSLDASEFIFDSQMIEVRSAFADFAWPSFTPDRPVLEAVLDLNHRIFKDFTFDSAATTLATPLQEVFERKRGVCQDFAHFEIACLRALGLPARYVSGYIETVPPEGRERLIGADATHAWVAFYIPGMGWIEVDPTNDCLPLDRHIILGWGRDYQDISPVRGVILGNGDHDLRVSVDVAAIADSSRGTRSG